MPREAALDSEFLTIAAQFGAERASRLTLGFKTRDINEFTTKVRMYLKGSEAVDENMDNEQIEEFNWLELGKKTKGLIKRTPAVEFM